MTSHPTVGLHDALKKYYLSQESKTQNKRRKLRDSTAAQALDRFVDDLSATVALTSSTLPRSRGMYVATSMSAKKSLKQNDDPSPAAETAEPQQQQPQSQPNEESTVERTDNDSKDDEKDAEVSSTAKTDIVDNTTQKSEDEAGTYVDLEQQDNEQLEQQEKQLAIDIEKIQDAKQQVYKDQVEIWGVYKYGLQHVLALNDLSAAPDAILPGNF